jgi:hypothetical protein
MRWQSLAHELDRIRNAITRATNADRERLLAQFAGLQHPLLDLAAISEHVCKLAAGADRFRGFPNLCTTLIFDFSPWAGLWDLAILR